MPTGGHAVTCITSPAGRTLYAPLLRQTAYPVSVWDNDAA